MENECFPGTFLDKVINNRLDGVSEPLLTSIYLDSNGRLQQKHPHF
jgi:hypothetical protein